MERLARTTSQAKVINTETHHQENGVQQFFTVVTNDPVNIKNGNLWVSTEKPPMAALEDVKGYLHRHPAPWTINDEMREGDGGRSYSAVLDAHGREVFGTYDFEDYSSGFTGGIHALVDVVNLMASVLEVEGEPRPATIDPENIGRWAELPDGTLGIITRLHRWNADGREDCYLTVPGKTEAVRVISDEVKVRTELARAWQSEGKPWNE